MMEFVFKNISVKCEHKGFIQGVSGRVKQCELLAVCSHSDNTNTLLLSTLAGRGHQDSGQIEVKGSTTSSSVRFVERHDLFLPTLSVGETIQYSADLRLGQDVSKRERRSVVNKILRLVGLYDIRNTQVLVALPKYKKLLSIACELVYNQPGVLIVDDPTAGLPLADAFEVIQILSEVARSHQLAVILSATYPNSSWLSVCHTIMFLSQHQMVYYGKPESLADFLLMVGSPCPPFLSPSDYIMELIQKKNKPDQELLDKMIQLSHSLWVVTSSESIRNNNLAERNTTENDTCGEVANRSCTEKEETSFSVDAESLLEHRSTHVKTFPSSFWHQMCVLTQRNFHNARRRILFPISIIQNLYILVLCVVVWWRPERTEQSVADRMGLFFFTTVQWAFFSLLDAILSFPKELKVYGQERRSKLYHVSALCLAKSLSELPLALLQPFVYMSVIYWVANLNSVKSFFLSLLVLTLDVYAAQSIGLFVGVALHPPWTISIVSLGLLSMMLWGGAFNKLPSFLSWGPYASFFTYGLRAFITLEFQDGAPIKCANSSMVPLCNAVDPLTNTTITHFPSDVVLTAQGLAWPFWYYTLVLGAIIVVFRCLWYFVFRQK